MSRSRPLTRLLTALFVALCPFRVAAERLNIGSIGADLKGEAHQLEPLAGYLTSRLKAVGVESVGVEVRSKPDDMRDAIAKGDVQIVVESPYEAAIMAQETGAVPSCGAGKRALPNTGVKSWSGPTGNLQICRRCAGGLSLWRILARPRAIICRA